MLLRGQSIAVIGVRRIGKTSVLLKTLKLTSGPRVYVSAEGYVEGKSFDLSSFVAYYSSLVISQALSRLEPKRRFPLTLKERSRELLRTLRDLLAYLKVTLDVNPVSIEFYFENKRRLGEALREVFELPQLLAQKIGSNFTIAIDESQYLKLAEQNHPGLFHPLRDTWQFQRNVTYLISGSSVGLLNHMIGSGDQPFYGFFYPVQLRSFSRGTLPRFLGEGLREEGVTYERGALEEAVNQLDGIPA
ncbi:hypothetical protein B9Q04_14445 [Candidatus Marsarchaeota G2 archaeon BE_D]|jgi:Predicted ATPase (AAA+ superfamily)|uniref:AAA domain-containing protein n=1 Tax=Candidatus Marsarchaeota G2 archaeon BE_D TaxID=1978158 RepID=A0A2R6C768_9ARCH|nr:MAG: hypothetical protein B9Q04_14445 [Candidatus Marsarchaeota G2 archaeon BE_D]